MTEGGAVEILDEDTVLQKIPRCPHEVVAVVVVSSCRSNPELVHSAVVVAVELCRSNPVSLSADQ